MDLPENPFAIDEGRLDEEWRKQSRVSRAGGVREADARHECNKAKARVKVVRAQTLLAVRRAPHLHGLREKPNESEVEAAVELSKEVQDAEAAVNVAQHALDIAVAEKFALGVDRREALRGLTDMLHINYFSMEPRDKASRQAADEAATKQAFRPIRRDREGGDGDG